MIIYAQKSTEWHDKTLGEKLTQKLQKKITEKNDKGQTDTRSIQNYSSEPYNSLSKWVWNEKKKQK